MNNIIGILIVFGVVIVFTLIPASIIWWLWNPVVTDIIPGLVDGGLVAKEIPFTSAYGIMFVVGCIIGFSSSSKSQ